MVRDHSQITVCGYTDTLLPPHDQLLAIIPPGGLGDYILEMNAGMEITPYLHTRSGYGHVRGCVSGEAGVIETRSVDLPDGETFTCQIDRFDLERDFYPYPNAHFKAIMCCELLETLKHDPMHMMDETHRILRPACHLILTTRRYTAEQIGSLLENCGLEVTLLESGGDRVFAAARKVGPVRERYPGWLYPERR